MQLLLYTSQYVRTTYTCCCAFHPPSSPSPYSDIPDPGICTENDKKGYTPPKQAIDMKGDIVFCLRSNRTPNTQQKLLSFDVYMYLCRLLPYMTGYTIPPVIYFGSWNSITRVGIPWGCGIHRTPGDKVGGCLGF